MWIGPLTASDRWPDYYWTAKHVFPTDPTKSPLQWRHNEHDNLLNRLSKRRSKKTSKLRVTGLCGGNSFNGDRWIPPQRASNAENFSIWWRHHESRKIWAWIVRSNWNFTGISATEWFYTAAVCLRYIAWSQEKTYYCLVRRAPLRKVVNAIGLLVTLHWSLSWKIPSIQFKIFGSFSLKMSYAGLISMVNETLLHQMNINK